MNKKIVFITGTRADFGKIKPLMRAIQEREGYEVHVFVTGMHMFSKYGNTGSEILKSGFENIYYYINQKPNDSMDTILANTIQGLGNYLDLVKPDLIVVHGDRIETLAGAISGALNNYLVAHIEGGEVSGTIDESIRHSASKMAHIHFVANDEAKARLIRMGEPESNIYIIGSPDIDRMMATDLPSIEEVKSYYEIPFDDQFSILLYHPVTTNLHNLYDNFKAVMDSLKESGKKYVMIYPNNDPGADMIIEEIELLRNNSRFKIFPSMRFEYFLVLMKNCEFMIGNSSAGIREAPIYSVPTINIGNRQKNRFSWNTIVHVDESKDEILEAIRNIHLVERIPTNHFGDGRSTEGFIDVLTNDEFWKTEIQKYFVDKEQPISI